MLVTVLVFFLLLRLVVKVPVVQTWLVKQAAGYLSDELGVAVEIKAVDIRFFRSLALEGVFIQDQQKDTLLYAEDLEVALSQFSYKKRRVTVSSVTLENSRIWLKRYKDPRDYNLDFIIDYFSGSGKDTTSSAPWDIKVNAVDIRNCHFSYQDLKYSDKDWGIDWEDIDVHNLNVSLSDVRPEGDSLRFKVNHLSLLEKSGFGVKDLQADAMIKAGHWEFKKLHAQTEKSDVRLDLRFDFNSMEDFEDFITKVNCTGNFTRSYIDFRDLTYFARELRNLNRGLSFSGKVKGTVDRFKGKNIELYYTDHTYFKGNVNMTGLPDFFETYMEVTVDDLGFNHKDLETVPAWPFDSLQNLDLPDEIKQLGDVHFKGTFNGFYNDFVAYGNATSAIGYVSSDLNLKIGDQDRQTFYKGSLRLFDVDMGKLWSVPQLGKVSMKAGLEGRGFELKNITANIEADIASLEFKNYRYNDIDLNGHFEKKMFTGEILAADKHLDLDFEGSIDLNADRPLFNFNSSIRKADITALKLLNRADDAMLSAEVSINMTGSHLDDAEGLIQIDQLVYSEDGKTIKADQIYLENKLGLKREFSLISDFADLRVAGNYTFSDLPQTIDYFIATYVPALTEANSVRPKSQEFSFKGKIKRTEELLGIFKPELSIDRGTVVEGNVNTNQNSLSLLLQSDEIAWGGVLFNQVHVDGHTDTSNFWFNTSIDELILNDSISINEVGLKGFTNRDTSSVLVDLAGADSNKTIASFYINSGFINTGYTNVKIIPRKLMLDGNQWQLDANNYLLADTTGLLFNEFELISGNQRISFNGILGADTTARLEVGFHQFEAGQLNDLLSVYHVNIGGVVNGEATFSALAGKPALNADLDVQNLQWYGDTLGSADFLAFWDSMLDKVSVNGEVTRGGVKNIQISGDYFILEHGDRLDFTAKLQKTYVKTFAYYLKDLVSDVNGIASGELHLKGSSSEPELTGKLFLQRVSFVIDYLKTAYSFSTEVDVKKDRFVFKNVELNDVKGNHAYVDGEIRHKNLDDFYFDINIQANKTQVLNTGPSDNELYYGVAYASGKVYIHGPLDYIVMDMGLESEKGTSINIPLSNPEEVSRSGFITFINRKDTLPVVEEGPDISGIELNMEFDVRTNAKIYLIFDQKIGDVIEGSGEGTINMKISPSEDLRMWGNFNIASGKYLFTMQNVINKPFTIEKGGTIKWSGDPYDALIDISAVYSKRVGLYDLFQDSSFRKLTPVDLRLHLTEQLFNPNISFDIKVQNVDPNTETQIKRLINTEEEMYRQAVALLVMNRFTTPSEVSNKSTVSSGSVVGVNAYEMLSNQLSNWASQISNQVNVGLNYRPGDALTSEELQVALSTSLFNDRVTIDGNVGVANTGTNTTNQNTSNLVGDFNVEVKASKDGHVRFKAFNRSNNNSLINNVNSQYTQGVGAFYRVEFNTFSELYQKILDIFRRKSKKRMQPQEAVPAKQEEHEIQKP